MTFNLVYLLKFLNHFFIYFTYNTYFIYFTVFFTAYGLLTVFNLVSSGLALCCLTGSLAGTLVV